MKPVDYDTVAAAYDRRYELNVYDGTAAYLRRFVEGAGHKVVAEVGCGTGHWLGELSKLGIPTVLGADLSFGMLERAQRGAPRALLARANAAQLPWAAASVDRLFCINALHHFTDRPAFMRECRRVLRPGGAFLTIALDPHRGTDRWWVYDFFPAALAADRARYPATTTIEAELRAAGFRETTVDIAQHFPRERSFAVAREEGSLDRRHTSQLMVISDDEFEAGMARVLREQPVLRSDLTLYATMASV